MESPFQKIPRDFFIPLEMTAIRPMATKSIKMYSTTAWPLCCCLLGCRKLRAMVGILA